MTLQFNPFELHLKHVFTLASGSRSTTPDMLTEIRYEDTVGYGEASMPPYLGESVEGSSQGSSAFNSLIIFRALS